MIVVKGGKEIVDIIVGRRNMVAKYVGSSLVWQKVKRLIGWLHGDGWVHGRGWFYK